MKKLLFGFIASLLLVLPAFGLTQGVLAQSDSTTTTYDDYDWGSYYDDWDSTYNVTDDVATAGAAAGIFGLLFGGIMLVVSIVFSLGMYIYSAVTLMAIAKKLGEQNSWFAWIPILNLVLLYKMGDQNPTLLLLLLIPGVGALIIGILSIIAIMNICEKRGYDKLLGLLMLVPLANLVLLGMLAWGKKQA